MLVALACGFTFARAEDARMYSPTELVEMSDVLRAEWNRLHGKVEGALPEKSQAEAVQTRLSTWLDEAGDATPRKFDQAQAELAQKLKALEASLDAARASGTLASWDPKQPSSQAQAPQSSASGPAVPAAMTVAATSPPSPAREHKEERPTSAGAANDMSPAAQWLTVAITLVGGALGFFLYPRLFQPKSDLHFRSWLQRLNKRIGITVGFLFFSYLLGYAVAAATFGQ
jgi:hypothetical protein